MKTQLLSTLQTLKSVRSGSKAMKNDSFLSDAMDFPEENGSCNCNVDGENEFDNGSNYNEGEGLEAKQSGNVNSSPSQWPLRHNNHNESLDRHDSYSCNGFRQAKKPRYTYTGRISRIPSRYLDTDSDSPDGSVGKDGQSRLKVKRSRRRRRPPSSSSKLLVNGFKEHRGNALLLSVAEFEADTITDINLEENEQEEGLANVEYPDVFEQTSPISNDKISHDVFETQDNRISHQNTSLSDEITSSRTSQIDSMHGVLEPIMVDNFCKQTIAEHSSTSSSCCVDISSKNNGRTRFETLTESPDETIVETHLEIDQTNKKTLENCSKTFVNTPSKRKNLHDDSKCDSSTNQTLVSSVQISKGYQVSCAIHNDTSESFLERKNCKNCKECALKSSCISDEDIQNNENKSSGKRKIAVGKSDIDNKLPKKKRLVKTTKKASRKLASTDEPKDSNPNILLPKTVALDPLKDLKMRKAFAKKIKQKQLRRNEKAGKNNVFKRNGKNGVVRKIRQKSVVKVNNEKMDKVTNKVNRKKVNKAAKVKDAEVTKPSEGTEVLDRVLGMRQSPSGVYEFLVEWRNGTSCWVSSDEIVTDKHNYCLREYLVESEQDVSVVNRVPFQAYCCDSLSLKECVPVSKSKEALKKMLCMEPVQKKVCKSPVVAAAKPKNDVAVEYVDNYCHVKLNRETCKRKKTCLKIMTDLITALEDAATSECEVVVIQGLGSDVLCGLKLEDMSKARVDGKEHVTLSQARYLVQTLTNYPKLLVALISKSAEGIGAVFLSLFDMICDEETWNKKQILTPCEEETAGKKSYTLPRLTGHSLLSEEILMGRRIGASESCSPMSPGYDACLTDTSTVAKTLMEIETTLRLLGKETSLLQENGQFAELFPTSMPSFALFSDIKSDFLSEHGEDSCLNDPVNTEGYTIHGYSSPKRTFPDDLLFTDETKSDHKVDITTDQSATDHTITDRSTTKLATTDQLTTDDATTDQSTEFNVAHTNIDHSSMEQYAIDHSIAKQRTSHHPSTDQSMTDDAEMKVAHTNIDYDSMEQSTMYHSIADQCTSDHASTDQSMTSDATTVQSTTKSKKMDHTDNIEQNAMDHSTSEQSTTKHANSDQNMIDDAAADQSAISQVNMNQSTTESNVDHTNTDSMEKSTMDHSMTDHSTSDHASNEQSTIDHSITGESTNCHAGKEQRTIAHSITGESTSDHERRATNHSITDQTNMDHTTTDNSAMDQDVDDNEMLNLADDHTIAACNSTTCTEADAGSTETIDSSIKHYVDDHPSVCTTANNGDTTAAQVENSLKQALSDRCITDSTMLDPTVTKVTNDVTMVNSNVSDCTATKTCSMTDSKELITKDKGNFITDIDERTSEHVQTEHNIPVPISSKCDTSNQCTRDYHKNDVTLDTNIDGTDITGKPGSTMQDIKDKTSEQDANGDTEIKTLPSSSPTQNYANVTDIVGNQNSTNHANNTDCNTQITENSTFNTEMFEEQKTNERVESKLTILDSSSGTNQITVNDIDITNYSSKVDNCPSKTVHHAMTDPIHDHATKHATEPTRINDNLASSSSAAAASDRYLKKLESQVEAERRQAQRYIEQISRLWDGPFLSKNKS